MPNWFSRVGVLLLPFIFWVSGVEQFREPKALALVAIMALYISGAMIAKINFFLGFSFFACVISGSFLGRIVHYDDLLIFTAAGISCLWVAEEDKPEILFKLLELAGLLCALHGLIQYFGLDPVVKYLEWADRRPVALFGQHTLYGPFAVSAFAVSLFYRHWWRALFLLIPIFLIDSSFTFLSLGVVLGLWLYANLRKEVFLGLLIATSITLGTAFLMAPGVMHREFMNDKGRFALWSQTLELAKRRPILGYGFGSFKEIYPVFQSKELRAKNGISEDSLSPEAKEFIARAERVRAESGLFQSAHNEFVQVVFEMGALGLVCVFGLIFTFVSAFRKSVKTTETWIACAIFWLFMANSLGNFPLHLVPQALLPLWSYVIVTRWRTVANMRVYGRPNSRTAL